MKNVRRGMGIGKGSGYYNIVPIDSHIHSLSAKGVKSIYNPKGNPQYGKLLLKSQDYKYIKDKNGSSYPRIRYGDEFPKWAGKYCHDCGVAKGHYHGEGCDVERSPFPEDDYFDKRTGKWYKGQLLSSEYAGDYSMYAKGMDCETFKRGINEFRGHPILFNRLLEKHLKEHPNCKCNVKYINPYTKHKQIFHVIDNDMEFEMNYDKEQLIKYANELNDNQDKPRKEIKTVEDAKKLLLEDFNIDVRSLNAKGVDYSEALIPKSEAVIPKAKAVVPFLNAKGKKLPEGADLIYQQELNWIPKGWKLVTEYWNDNNAHILVGKVNGKYMILRTFIGGNQAHTSVDYANLDEESLPHIMSQRKYTNQMSAKGKKKKPTADEIMEKGEFIEEYPTDSFGGSNTGRASVYKYKGHKWEINTPDLDMTEEGKEEVNRLDAKKKLRRRAWQKVIPKHLERDVVGYNPQEHEYYYYHKMDAKGKVPEGFAFIDWQDAVGKTWKDVVPRGYMDVFKLNVLSKGGKIKKVRLDARGIGVGTKVEMEHTTDKKIARKIAETHLKENKDYYKFYDPKDKKAKEYLVTMHGKTLKAQLTLEKAKRLKHGDILITPDFENADGTPQRWKVTGKVKTWKKDPTKIKVPIKRGLYEYNYITEENIGLFDEPF